MSTMIFVIKVVKMLWTHEAQPSDFTTNVYLFFYHNIDIKYNALIIASLLASWIATLLPIVVK